MAPGAEKPIPLPTQVDLPYWQGLREGRLVLSRCDSCGTYRQRQILLCGICGGESFTWTQVSGRGTIYAFCIVHQTWISGFDEDVPYVIAAISIMEQPSLVLTTNLVGDFDMERLTLGQSVRATVELRGDEALLQFELDN